MGKRSIHRSCSLRVRTNRSAHPSPSGPRTKAGYPRCPASTVSLGRGRAGGGVRARTAAASQRPPALGKGRDGFRWVVLSRLGRGRARLGCGRRRGGGRRELRHDYGSHLRRVPPVPGPGRSGWCVRMPAGARWPGFLPAHQRPALDDLLGARSPSACACRCGCGMLRPCSTGCGFCSVVRVQNAVRDQAARSYTWWRPPSTGRARIGPVAVSGSLGGGAASWSVRWGRSRL